jgi:hypothetical protein
VLAELSKLQDRIEPFSTQEARRMIEQELGQPIDVVFSEFSEKPIAAASLAQVRPVTWGYCCTDLWQQELAGLAGHTCACVQKVR